MRRRDPSGSVLVAGAVNGTTDAGCMSPFNAVARDARYLRALGR
jgi:hypothetical protein